MGTTPMIAPDGSSGEIPDAKVADAVKAGGKVGAWMLAPDGSRGIVPVDKTLDAIKAGARPQAPLPDVRMHETGAFGVQYNRLTDEQQRIKGEYESANLKPIAETLGAMATAGLLKTPGGATMASKLLHLAGRSALSAAGVGGGAFAAGASPQEVQGAAESGAVAQPVAEGASAAASSLAPKIAESALKITDRMRGRGRTIGEAVLENTTGIKASTLAPEIRQAIGSITQDMEAATHAATQSGVTGSAQPAQQALNDAISKLPRNARTVAAKLNGLHDLLDLGGGPQASYTPDELLEMKRGIGKEMGTWGMEWQKLSDVQAVRERLYGAIDGELDRLIPGNAEKNQIISSLIPAKQQATRISGGATIAERMAHRMAAHTGALASAGFGGTLGYEKGGVPGAAAGAIAGLAIPEVATSTPGQMAAARLFNSLGETATSNASHILPLIKALAAQTATPNTPGLPFHPGAGISR
jgi:hypothetical protein